MRRARSGIEDVLSVGYHPPPPPPPELPPPPPPPPPPPEEEDGAETPEEMDAAAAAQLAEAPAPPKLPPPPVQPPAGEGPPEEDEEPEERPELETATPAAAAGAVAKDLAHRSASGPRPSARTYGYQSSDSRGEGERSSLAKNLCAARSFFRSAILAALARMRAMSKTADTSPS